MDKSQTTVVEDLVSGFRDNLTRIIAQARRDTIHALTSRLTVADGVVIRSRANARILQTVDAVFQRAMNRAGYPALVRQYVSSFNGQFEFFEKSIERLGLEPVKFGARDKAAFVAQQVNTVQMIDRVIDGVAATAERQAMISVGGLKLADLITAVSQKLDIGVTQATSVADTALSVFYRTIQARGFELIDRSLSEHVEMRYSYGGPDDRLVRPFCRAHLTQSANGVTWTREQIDQMSNSQLPGVFLTCGGWNCRHQWLLQPLRAKA